MSKIWRNLVVVSAVFCTCTSLYAGCEELLRQFSPQEIAAAQRVWELQMSVTGSRDKAGLTETASKQAAEAVAFNQLYQGLKIAHPKMTPEDLRTALKTFTSKKDGGREEIKVMTEEEMRELEKTRKSFRPIFEEAARKDKNIILEAPPESFEFVKILGENSVTVELGSPESEVGRGNNEPLRTVTLSGPLQMQRTPFTQEQWVSLIQRENPSNFHNENQVTLLGINLSHGHPVEQVSWNDIQEVIKLLNERDTRYKYALSPEVVWEYAARAGSSAPYYFGKDESLLEQHAWYSENSGGKTHQVATRLANPFGLFDMYGNVREWGQDNYMSTPASGTTFPFENGDSDRVVRGGSWYNDAQVQRSAFRSGFPAGFSNRVVGFRLVRTPK